MRPLALIICSSSELSQDDLRFVQAYQALRQQVGEAGQRQLEQEAVDFTNSVLRDCGVPEAGPVSGSPDCIGAQYNRQRSYWVARLSGAANEEANRPISQHVALQRSLWELGYSASTGSADGVYGPGTRTAIGAWQRANGRAATGFIGEDDAEAIERELSKLHAPYLSNQAVANAPAAQPAPAAPVLSLTPPAPVSPPSLDVKKPVFTNGKAIICDSHVTTDPDCKELPPNTPVTLIERGPHEDFRVRTQGGDVGWMFSHGLRNAVDQSSSDAARADIPSNVNILLELWRQKNDKCRRGEGDDIQTQIACDAREGYDKQLDALGWCYGKKGQADYQMEWHPCGPDSLKHDRGAQSAGTPSANPKTLQYDPIKAEHAASLANADAEMFNCASGMAHFWLNPPWNMRDRNAIIENIITEASNVPSCQHYAILYTAPGRYGAGLTSQEAAQRTREIAERALDLQLAPGR